MDSKDFFSSRLTFVCVCGVFLLGLVEKKKTELCQELSLQARDLRFQHSTSLTARNNCIIIRMETVEVAALAVNPAVSFGGVGSRVADAHSLLAHPSAAAHWGARALPTARLPVTGAVAASCGSPRSGFQCRTRRTHTGRTPETRDRCKQDCSPYCSSCTHTYLMCPPQPAMSSLSSVLQRGPVMSGSLHHAHSGPAWIHCYNSVCEGIFPCGPSWGR
ncbi:Magnesium transporter MRS2, mitochondrial [Merluccius polli]|uniref:Magnesium transporter MRS2, mitochondrial n=1 Tax=Merluccius polli TaxID=89951 RepID=A0AA47N7K6_MERPO|nr:Magnesium transporter MRS2, mitochondrial [Merluccius polli]